ncbi:immunity 49 family protein [Streptomyces sp. NPDC002589]|uniref:immunity 49 family protein n=1 Tax=Streptomyces sp. NPDC002589 TaxID=3154420 RepID=UPI003322E3C4
MPTNSVDTHVPTGTGDHTVPAPGAGDHLPGGHTGDVNTPGHGLPGHGGDTHLPGHGAEPHTGPGGAGGIGNDALDHPGGAGDDATHGTHGPAHHADEAARHRAEYEAAREKPAEQRTADAWVTAMQVGCGLFAAGTATEGPVPCRVGSTGEVKHLPATGPQDYLHAGNWLTSFYLAVICRENDRVNQLAQVPVSFLRASGAEFDEYLYAWVETLQNRWFGRQETWDTLTTAINGTAPEAARIAGPELMLKILYPPLELFHRYLRRETEQFNASLVDALTWHKEYWTANEARSLSGEGLVALAPLAIACMAHDADMLIDVESEYLPRALLKRSWVGEYQT